MKAYKGFDKDLKCRGYQFYEDKVHTEPEAKCVKNGFHCAENPLDCLSYYSDIKNSVYYIVDAAGDINEDGTDTKISCTEMTLTKKLSLEEFILESLIYMKQHPRRELNRHVTNGEASARDKFAISRCKEPMAAGMSGDILGFAKEKPNSNDIEKIAVFKVDNVRINAGIFYTIDGIPANNKERQEVLL